MAGKPRQQMPFHVWPFESQDAVHNAVSHRTVSPGVMMADDAVLVRAERFNGSLRCKVEVVGPESNDSTPQGVESVFQQEQLTRSVDPAALPAGRIPGVADLDSIDLGGNVVVAGASYNRIRLHLPHGPGQHMAGPLTFERIGDVPLGLVRSGHRGKPELPEPAVGSGGGQPVLMAGGQWLQPHAVTLERDRGCDDHEQPCLETNDGARSAGSSRSQNISNAGPSGVWRTSVARKPAFS